MNIGVPKSEKGVTISKEKKKKNLIYLLVSLIRVLYPVAWAVATQLHCMLPLLIRFLVIKKIKLMKSCKNKIL